MPSIQFEKELNPEQLAAATAGDGPIFVLAAAGTGKTRTLVYRVAYLSSKGVDPQHILLLTFTNRAAGEMLERAETLVGPGISGVWGGTFHHMANRILRRYADRLGFPHDYTILDREDSRSLVNDALRQLGLAGKEFPKANVLLSVFSAAINTGCAIPETLETRFPDLLPDAADIARVEAKYQERKRASHGMDFDDLLTHCLNLFRLHADVRERYQRQFRYVLVDEYQDTNPVQAGLVDCVAALNRNVLVVGDDFQSIYGWRGADFRNIMTFPQRYPDAFTVKLETNYRSVPEILDVANACIRGNPDQFLKTMRPTREAYKKPLLARLRDGEEQAHFVIQRIRALRREGYRLSDIAVLYRAHYQAMELQMLLTREQLPYLITSGVRFFEQAHIKDVCSLLRLLHSPGDETAFLRLLSLLPGIGDRTAASLWQKVGGRFDAQQAAARAQLESFLKPAAREAWKHIDPILAAFHAEALQNNPGEIIQRFTAAFYEKHAVNSFDDADRRLDEIRELILYTGKFPSLEQFLSDVALLTNLDAEIESVGAANAEVVRLTTVHQAKGLEWPVVLVLWVTDGMFPLARSVTDSCGGEAEERRLFYVAVTRAKDELTLCMPEVRRTRDGGVMYCPPSRFVEELPPGLLRTSRNPGA